MKIGVIVGRFQIDNLHTGYLKLLNEVHKRSDEVVVCLGVKPTPSNKKNPLDFLNRYNTLNQSYTNCYIIPVIDHPSNEQWSKNLDYLLDSLFMGKEITLYTGRDGFNEHYTGKYPVEVITTDIDHLNSSDRREIVGNATINSPDFRAGIIYAINNLPPRNYLTVDIACVDEKADKVLLGRKRGQSVYCFPGGFYDPKDGNPLNAARREFCEETSLGCEGGEDLVGVYHIDDWRNRDSPDVNTMTFFYTWPYCFGRAEAADDLEEVIWVPISPTPVVKLNPAHKVLWDALWIYRHTAISCKIDETAHFESIAHPIPSTELQSSSTNG